MICVVLITSCKQELCQWSQQGDNSTIQVSVDWSMSYIDQTDIYNMSIYGYPQSGGAPYLKVSGNIELANIYLTAGYYSMLVFNDIVGDIEGINFRNSDSYDDFYAEVIEQSDTSGLYYKVDDDELLASTQGQLATWLMEELEVVQDMEYCSYCEEYHREVVELYATPNPITTECQFTLRIENLNNAQIIQGVVRGFAAGAYLASAERLTSPDRTIIYSIDFTSRLYDDTDSVDGVVESQITTFGKVADEDQSYELILDIILNNGELVSFTRDITDQVVEQNNLNIVINLLSDENMISLPESDGIGFGVDKWGDKESIELM